MDISPQSLSRMYEIITRTYTSKELQAPWYDLIRTYDIISRNNTTAAGENTHDPLGLRYCSIPTMIFDSKLIKVCDRSFSVFTT